MSTTTPCGLSCCDSFLSCASIRFPSSPRAAISAIAFKSLQSALQRCPKHFHGQSLCSAECFLFRKSNSFAPIRTMQCPSRILPLSCGTCDLQKQLSERRLKEYLRRAKKRQETYGRNAQLGYTLGSIPSDEGVRSDCLGRVLVLGADNDYWIDAEALEETARYWNGRGSRPMVVRDAPHNFMLDQNWRKGNHNHFPTLHREKRIPFDSSITSCLFRTWLVVPHLSSPRHPPAKVPMSWSTGCNGLQRRMTL